MSKCFWKSGTDGLAQGKVFTKFQFVSTKCNKAKHSKTRYACTKKIRKPSYVFSANFMLILCFDIAFCILFWVEPSHREQFIKNSTILTSFGEIQSDNYSKAIGENI